MNWHVYFLGIVKAVAQKSKDESTKIGAVIVGPDKEIRSTGFNGFSRGINEEDKLRWNRPVKYQRIVHAEQNAIYNAAKVGTPTDECVLYVSGTPCTECAKAVIQAGIKAVVYPIDHPFKQRADWSKDMQFAHEMLSEAGVSVITIYGENQ